MKRIAKIDQNHQNKAKVTHVDELTSGKVSAV